MQVHLCGTRGSTPAPGRDFVRYGGHTSSVALAHDGESPTLILDAGTGIRQVTTLLEGQPFRGAVLLSHLHWDHVHGLPFFRSAGLPGAQVRVLVPAPDGDPVGVLARGMSPPHFPVSPLQLGADGESWEFAALTEGELQIGRFRVLAREIPHKGGQTFGFRVSDGTASIAYLSDHAPLGVGPGPDGLGDYHPAALELADGVDVLLHDAQFLAAEFPGVAYLGHAAIEYAVNLAAKAGAAQLVLFHHAPDRTDDALDAIVAAQSGAAVPVVAAADGMVLQLPTGSSRPLPN